DAGVIVEVLVLGGEEGAHHAPRNGLDRHEDALLGRVLGDQPAVTSVHPGDRRRLVVGELAVLGQAAAVVIEEIEHAAGAGDRQDNRQRDEDAENLQGSSQAFYSAVTAARAPARMSMLGKEALR